MSDCPSEQALRMLIENRLDPERRQEVATHLGTCPRCATHLKDLDARTGGDDGGPAGEARATASAERRARRLAVASLDGTVKLWEADKGP